MKGFQVDINIINSRPPELVQTYSDPNGGEFNADESHVKKSVRNHLTQPMDPEKKVWTLFSLLNKESPKV